MGNCGKKNVQHLGLWNTLQKNKKNCNTLVEENKFRKINSEIHCYCNIDASDQLVKTYKPATLKHEGNHAYNLDIDI
jgi:hypothetical protein